MQTKTLNVGGKELDDAIFQVIRRASVDPEFRSLALANGNAALAKISPELATAVDIRFLDKANINPTRVSVNLVLPDLVEAGELSETELEQVAGGLEASKQLHGVDIQTA